MKSLAGGKLDTSLRRKLALVTGLLTFSFIWQGASAAAKDPSLTAIELYSSSSGPAFVQLGDVLINGKAELRGCTAASSGTIDKSTYGKLPRISITAGGILERDDEGALRYSDPNGSPTCVVPDNVKFGHVASMSISAMGDSAELTGRPIGLGSAGATPAQPLNKGVKLVFISTPSLETAEFLLAQRIGAIQNWQNFLAGYPESAHTGEAKRALAVLYLASGETELAAYVKTADAGSPSYSSLKDAKAMADSAVTIAPDLSPSTKFALAVQDHLKSLAGKGQTEYDAYVKALADAQAGYLHLKNAQKIADAIIGIDPKFAPGKKLQDEVSQARNNYEAVIRTANSAAQAKQWEQALSALQPYRQSLNEDPRVGKIIDDAYAAFYEQAKQADEAKDWPTSIAAYQTALNTKESAEAAAGLKAAQEQLLVTRTKAAAQSALDKSKTYESQHELIPAYEVLASLPKNQQSLVEEDMARLEPAYVSAVSQKAASLAKLYPSIGGIGDERAVETAYNYLKQADDLSEDDVARRSFHSRLQSLGDELSVWFLDRAKHCLQKPLGSETELGWTYLKEAESYKAVNLEEVRDQLKSAAIAHDMHSKVSVRVQFRDQTSQRQSEGFANQMENAIAAGLDKSDIAVKVIRSGEATHSDVEPDFLIAGDVLEHNISAPPTEESVESKYVAGVHDQINEEWNKVNQQYQAAQEELHSAEAALQGAEAKGNKKQIQDTAKQAAQARKSVDDLRSKLDSTPKSTTTDIIHPYRYRKTIYNVLNHIVLQFRIDDSLSGQKGDPEQISKEEKQQFVVLNDVSPSDINAVHAQGTIPDKAELQEELENVAREELIRRLQQRVNALPRKLYDDATKREQDGYLEDAGEAYLRYLNVAPAEQVPEREHAEKFLHDKFNFLILPTTVTEPQRSIPPLVQGMATSPK